MYVCINHVHFFLSVLIFHGMHFHWVLITYNNRFSIEKGLISVFKHEKMEDSVSFFNLFLTWLKHICQMYFFSKLFDENISPTYGRLTRLCSVLLFMPSSCYFLLQWLEKFWGWGLSFNIGFKITYYI